MTSVPVGSSELVHSAARFDSVTFVQPEIAVPFEVKLTVPEKSQTLTVNLPPIEYLPAEATPSSAAGAGTAAGTSASTSATPSDTRPWFSSHQRTIGLVVGGVGVVGVGIGSVFGLSAKSTYDQSSAHCNGDHCDSTGHDFRQSAFSKATVSDIAFGVGGAALVGGVVLFLTAPKGEAPHTAVIPIIGPNSGSISLARTW